MGDDVVNRSRDLKINRHTRRPKWSTNSIKQPLDSATSIDEANERKNLPFYWLDIITRICLETLQTCLQQYTNSSCRDS